jgi:hypothetical protein
LPGDPPVERFAVDAAQIERGNDFAFGRNLEGFQQS